MHGDENTPKKGKRWLLTQAFEWVGTMVVSLTVIVLLLAFFLRMVGVHGDSMLPTLQNADRLLLSTVSAGYEPGDIVVVDRYTDEPLIKRVIAVEGDVVEITAENQLFVNGVLQQEDYTQGVTFQRDMIHGPVTVPAGCLFVLGDNRTISKDSRFQEIGMVSKKDVVGKVLVRMWPIAKWGRVD